VNRRILTTDVASRFAGIVGPQGVVLDPAGMAPYLKDWRGKFLGSAVAVFRPASTAEAASVVRLARGLGLAIVPQGGNTGLAGGAIPDRSTQQIVVAFERMNRIRDLDVVDNVIIAEAGCILRTAQDRAAEAGRLLPVSIASEGSAHIGGIVATNAGGVNVLRYGTTRQLVLGVEVVLPSGEVLDRLTRLRRDNAGYDLKQLFIGCEGTLGLITAASLRLFPRVTQSATALVQVAQLSAVLELFVLLNEQLGDFLSSFELISAHAYRATVAQLGDTQWPFRDGWAVLIELGVSSPACNLQQALEIALEGALEREIALDVVIAQNIAQARALWRVRESLSEGERALGPSIKHDVSVPVSRTVKLIDNAERGLASRFPGVRLNIFGHVGDGNIHLNVIHTTQQAADDPSFDLVAEEGGVSPQSMG